MARRETARQKFKELAKLAEAQRAPASAALPSSGHWSCSPAPSPSSTAASSASSGASTSDASGAPHDDERLAGPQADAALLDREPLSVPPPPSSRASVPPGISWTTPAPGAASSASIPPPPPLPEDDAPAHERRSSLRSSAGVLAAVVVASAFLGAGRWVRGRGEAAPAPIVIATRSPVIAQPPPAAPEAAGAALEAARGEPSGATGAAGQSTTVRAALQAPGAGGMAGVSAPPTLPAALRPPVPVVSPPAVADVSTLPATAGVRSTGDPVPGGLRSNEPAHPSVRPPTPAKPRTAASGGPPAPVASATSGAPDRGAASLEDLMRQAVGSPGAGDNSGE